MHYIDPADPAEGGGNWNEEAEILLHNLLHASAEDLESEIYELSSRFSFLVPEPGTPLLDAEGYYSPELMQVLDACREHPNWRVRRAALDFYGKFLIHDPAWQKVTDHVRSDPHPAVRKRIVEEILARIAGPDGDAMQFEGYVLETTPYEVVPLVRGREAGALELLRGVAESDLSPEVRAKAAEALGRAGRSPSEEAPGPR